MHFFLLLSLNHSLFAHSFAVVSSSLACLLALFLLTFFFVMALTQSYFLKMKLKIESNFHLNRPKKSHC